MSNAVIQGRYVLRACIVNFHTCLADAEAVPALAAHIGRELDGRTRPGTLRSGVSVAQSLL